LEIPEDFRLLNFEESNYLNRQGKNQPAYKITKNGLVILAMGFTGKKAMKFKIAYIKAFDKMEQHITSQRSRGCEQIKIDSDDRVSQLQLEMSENTAKLRQHMRDRELDYSVRIYHLEKRLELERERYDQLVRDVIKDQRESNNQLALEIAKLKRSVPVNKPAPVMHLYTPQEQVKTSILNKSHNHNHGILDFLKKFRKTDKDKAFRQRSQK